MNVEVIIQKMGVKYMKDVVDFLKLPPNILGALAIASGILLLLPDKVINKLYMTEFRNKYGFAIGIIFIVSLSILIILLILKIYHLFYDKRLDKKVAEGQLKYLRNMNREKVMILNAFLQERTHTLELPMNDGLVIELQHFGVITPAGQNHLVSMPDPRIKYFLQPWVEIKIRSNDELMRKFGIS